MTREQIDQFIEMGDPSAFWAFFKHEDKTSELYSDIHEAFLSAVDNGMIDSNYGTGLTPAIPGREAVIAMAYGILGIATREAGDNLELLGNLLRDASEVGYFGTEFGGWYPDALLCGSTFSDELGWFFLDGLKELYGERQKTVWEIGHTGRMEYK